MIPDRYDEDTPPGERRLFQRFASEPGADNWFVLHSLAIAKHVRQSQGEADFIVIMPGIGIAVIEVKSHKSVRRSEDGWWQLGNDSPTLRGPFKQVDGALHSIKNYLRLHGIDLRSVPIFSAVWFTEIQARKVLQDSPEWHPWQLLDRSNVQDGVINSIRQFMKQGIEYDRHIGKIRNDETGFLDPQLAKKIVQTLRPKFDVILTSDDRMQMLEGELTDVLEEQFEALDAMQHNSRTIFTGPAGSGKTFLAMEAARRAAASGFNGYVICYNRFLGAELKAKLADQPLIKPSTFHAFLLEVSGETVPKQADSEFWQKILPNAAVEALLTTDKSLDFIIVDEAQDLISPEYLDVLDLMVKGGLRGGRCLFFGDFGRQQIYQSGSTLPLLTERVPDSAQYELTSNCRNLPRIGSAIELLGQLTPPYKRFRRKDNGTMPTYSWYVDGSSQEDLLVANVRDLLDQGYRSKDIVILSMIASSSIAETIENDWLKKKLAPFTISEPPAGKIRYCTVHAFKGLDSPAVILTDVDDPEIAGFQDLLYIGLSRSTSQLVMLARKDVIAPLLNTKKGLN